MKDFKQTKIVCTIGPASENKEVLISLINAGMNVMRLNFSHGDFEEHGGRIKTLKAINKEIATSVAIMLDTKGPEIRTHLFKDGKVEVKKGNKIRVAMEEVEGTVEKFSVSYPNLFNDVNVGDSLRLDDGILDLKIIEKDNAKKELVCEALNTHTIKNRRGVNAPFARLSMPFISAKDKADIEFGCDQDVDFIAASFTRRKDDILAIKEILKQKK